MRAVIRPEVWEAEALHARAGELRLRMDHGNLLFEGHPREGIINALLYGLRLIEIDGYNLGL